MTGGRPLRRAFAVACVAVAAGCASVAPAPSVPRAEPPRDAAFDAAGRMSARRGADGFAGQFAWSHAPGGDRFDVATPLGQVVARLSRDAAGVRVERPDEPPAAYPDWATLTRAVFGVAIPADGLAAWIRGAPVAGAGYDVERDAAGRPAVLRQSGWEIVYAYGDAGPAAPPARLVLRYPDSEPIEVRIVVDRWSAVVAAP